MNGLDYIIVGVIAVSALIGLWRGFMRETVSLLAWIIAFWLAMSFAEDLAGHLGGVIDNGGARLAAAFVVIFVGVLILGVIANYLLASLLKKAGVRTSDRVLGVLFGAARGVLVVALVVVLVELTPLVDSPGWRGSLLVGFFHPVAGHLHSVLPEGGEVRLTQGGLVSAADLHIHHSAAR